MMRTQIDPAAKTNGVSFPIGLRTLGSVLRTNPSTFRLPAEWEKHRACWVAWPSHGKLWQENLEGARSEFVAFCHAVSDVDSVLLLPRGEQLNVLVPDEHQLALAEAALRGLHAKFHVLPFGDIWLRDTGPVFVRTVTGEIRAARFSFNGWGERHALPYDSEIAESIAHASHTPVVDYPFVLEGGSVEVDGEGTLLTTRQCLLNANRNPGLTQEMIEENLRESLGADQVIWLDRGLVSDSADGHVDQVARFVRPGVVFCTETKTSDDPNRVIYDEIREELSSAVDAHGRKLQVIPVPSPGAVRDGEGNLLAASYLNFYISNTSVLVPTFGSPSDSEAVSIIARAFPKKRVIGLRANHLLSGGGTFHGMTQQEPL